MSRARSPRHGRQRGPTAWSASPDRSPWPRRRGPLSVSDRRSDGG